MRKKISLLLIAALCLTLTLSLAGCGDGAKPAAGGQQASVGLSDEELANVSIFPKSSIAFIGDTMPYFEDGVMNVFYLADERAGQKGYHPWALMRTRDYCTYEDVGIVIPYAEYASEQDNALGTGCVMKDKDGLYHAFYTGHNDYYDPKEAIMHATSTDMLNWTKLPEDTFTAGANYSQNDFRDPYVFYVEEDQCYWMLVVTRTEETGVIAKYTSTDLKKWTDAGIFFEDDLGYATNMECPSVLQYKGKWYLAFSDQWPDRVVHYRVSDSLKGTFTKPAVDVVDGSGFYAGRLETDGENLYLVGWNGTKISHDDYNDYDWGGNMVVHKLEQRADGTLKPMVTRGVAALLSHKHTTKPVMMTDSISVSGNAYQLAGSQYEIVQFGMPGDPCRIEVDLTDFEAGEVAGIGFSPDFDGVSCLNYVFNKAENRIEFYNTERIFDAEPESTIDFDFTGKDSIHVTILVDEYVATMYVDDEAALTTRMYHFQSNNWQLFGVNSAVRWENAAFYDTGAKE